MFPSLPFLDLSGFIGKVKRGEKKEGNANTEKSERKEIDTEKMPSKRNIRIGNVSGATGDAPHAMLRMAHTGDVDVITGDWLSEMNIAWNAIAKAGDPTLGYEGGFLTQLAETIDIIAEKRIKVITNAGALNTEALKVKIQELCVERGLVDFVVASVLGDDVTEQVLHGVKGAKEGKARRFQHLDHEELFLEDWDKNLSPTNAAAYIGAWGIVEALKNGADIVVCGRVTDASPVVS